MNYPNLKFQLNKNLDKKICLEFLEKKKAGIDFGRGIIRLYPQLEKVKGLSREEKQEIISEFVEDYYHRHKKELEVALKNFENSWSNCEEKFYRQVRKIFKNHPWPKGKYICYLSIFNCNPRFLKDKTFQAFFKHPLGICHVAAHELLHFVFYDYVEKKFPKATTRIGKEKLWEASEVFNSLVLSLPQFKKITGVKKEKGYPAHAKLLPQYQKIWQASRDIDQFLHTTLT